MRNVRERMSDVHLIAVHVHGSGIVHTKGGPVTGPADFAGKNCAALRGSNNLLAAMGQPPSVRTVPAPEALSKGVVEGGVIPWEITLPLKVHELTDSHSEVFLRYSDV